MKHTDTQLAETLIDGLGEDLASLIQGLDGELRHVEEITGLGTGSSRRCYKLVFRDNRIFKARRYESIESRITATALIPQLKEMPFSRLVSSEGDSTIEEWISGTPLKHGSIEESHIEQAASLLGRLHLIRDFPGDSPPPIPQAGWYLGHNKRNFMKLVQLKVIPEEHAHRLRAIAREDKPSDLDVGVIHTDFHPGNMIIDDKGLVHIIDNEDISLGGLDYDIARCWSRWPLTDRQREIFCNEYTRSRPMDNFLSHQRFWSIRALALTAHVQARHGRPTREFVEILERIYSGDTERVWPEPT